MFKNLFQKVKNNIQIVKTIKTLPKVCVLKGDQIFKNKVIVKSMLEMAIENAQFTLTLNNQQKVKITKLKNNGFSIATEIQKVSEGYLLNKEKAIELVISLVNLTNTMLECSPSLRYSAIYHRINRGQEIEDNSKLTNYATAEEWQKYRYSRGDA
jgi:ATP-dependent Lon protease